MRVWMTGALIGLLVALFQPALPASWLLWSLAMGGLLLALSNSGMWRLSSGVLLGYCWCCVAGLELQSRTLPQICERQPVTLEGIVEGLPRHTVFADGTVRQQFEFSVTALGPTECLGPAKILLSYYGREHISPGERWRFQALLRRPWGLANPGSFSFQAWYLQSGIHALGSVRGEGVRASGSAGLRQQHHRLRQRVSAAIEAVDMKPELRAVLRAITVADRSGLDPPMWQLFRELGITHLLVISGLHIGMVAGMGMLLGALLQRLLAPRGCYLRWHPGLLLALAGALAYAALAGFSIATQRALLMLLVFIFAALLQRRSSAWLNLLYACGLIVLVNPFAALGSGFWLSVGAVILLLWWSLWHPQQGLAGKILAVHLWMCVAMIPMTGWWFGGGSLVAGVVNAVMVPLVSAWVVPMSLLATGMELLSLPGPPTIWAWAIAPLDLLHPHAMDLLAVDTGWLYTDFTPGLLSAGLALVAMMCLLLPMAARVRALLIATLLPLLFLPQGRPGFGPRLVGLDVGQGTAVVLSSGEHSLLYDTGGGDPAGLTIADTVLLPYLRRAGISELDTLVVSHGDTDHSAGAGTVAGKLARSRTLLGQPLVALPDAGLCRPGAAWRWPDGTRFQILSGGPGDAADSNDTSCVLLIESRGYRFLLPGDISAERERDLVRYWRDQLDADWLLAAHHGSRSSSSEAWLKTVTPAHVLFTHGHASRFGHPHPEVVKRVERFGARWHSTAQSGATEYQLEGDGSVTITLYREKLTFWWM